MLPNNDNGKSPPGEILERKYTSKIPKGTRKRRKKGEITKLREELWELCREIVKQRDGYKCYTCGKVKRKKGALHTGHYIASSLCSNELRFDIKNLARQCYACNINRSGNTIRFQKYLTRDHGAEYVEELWTRNEATKGKTYSKEWFENKIKEYTLILQSSQYTPLY
jgi:5-methylcytosine-specific restriction endonuclease McrA